MCRAKFGPDRLDRLRSSWDAEAGRGAKGCVSGAETSGYTETSLRPASYVS